MVARPRAGLLLLAGLVACSPSLETPADVRIRCVEDDDCPSDRCSDTVGICIAPDDDDSPLRIVSVEALDSRRIVVVFNRIVDPRSASDFTVYGLSPSLSPEAASVADDQLSVTVQTTQQKLRTYLLDVVDVVDPIGRPLERAQKQFTGIGEQVSGLAPTPLAPLDRSIIADPVVTLTWSALDDAVDYAVEVVRLTPTGEVAVDGSPFVLRETELTVALAADATYSWRVTADVSREPPVTSSFAVFGDAIHVYCPATADCAAADAWDAGTAVNPSKRVGRAIALASFLSRDEVRIATRGGGAVYDEAFVVAPPLTRVRGGFDPTFTTVNPATPAIIRGDPATARVVTTGDVELSDLYLRTNDGVALTLSSVARLTGTRLTLESGDGGRPFDARRCTSGQPITFSNLTTSMLLGSATPIPARVTGDCAVTFEGARIGAAGLDVVAGSATIVDSVVDATTGPRLANQDFEGTDVTAVRVERGSVIVERSVVNAGALDDVSHRVALKVEDGGLARVDASVLVARRVGFGDCFPQNCQGVSRALHAVAPDSRSMDIVITNSVLAASAAYNTPIDTAATVRWSGPGRLSLIHDVVYVGDGIGMLVDPGASGANDVQVLDTAIVCAGDSVGGDNATNESPQLLRATAFVGCQTPYRRLGTAYTSAASIEAIDVPAPHTFVNLHVFAAPISATFPLYAGADAEPGTADDDWSCGPVCATLGESSSAEVCGADGASPCAVEVVTDSLGLSRTVPVSLGPRESD